MTENKVNNLLTIIHQILKNGHELSSINTILEKIALFANAEGAILWEKNQKSDHLITVAHWFKESEKETIHKLLAKESFTGQAILEDSPKYIQDLSKKTYTIYKNLFLERLGFKSIFIIPIKFNYNNEEDCSLGSLNFYSLHENNFSIYVRNNLITLSKIFPDLYQSIRERVTFQLVNEIDAHLRETESTNDFTKRKKIEKSFKKVTTILKNVFQCFEVSIFLNDPFKSVDYKRIASTWKPKGSKKSYKSSIKEGLTGWVLSNKKIVKIPDLSLFFEELDTIRIEYPDIDWLDTGNIKNAIKDELDIRDEQAENLQPLSFMAVPIIVGDELFGAIRCCTALKSPYYFSSIEVSMLNIIATRIGHTWKNWVQQKRIDAESLIWKKVIKSTNDLDDFILHDFTGSEQDEVRMFEKVLECLPEIIPDAEITDVRILNEETQELYFAAIHGEAWKKGSEEKVKERKDKVFSINGNSAGSEVYKNRELLILDPIKEGDPYDETFSQAKKMIVAPLIVGNKVFGVLDIRSVRKRNFNLHADQIAKLMGRQLAVYYNLIKAIREFQKIQGQQIQTYQDFSHQLRGPIYQALARSRQLVNLVNKDHNWYKKINAISGLCNKSHRVARNIRLFSDLSKNLPVKLRIFQVVSQDIKKLIRETCSDNKIIVDPDLRINIEVNDGSFNIIDKVRLRLDIEMLEQAINVLLDNAFKYSYRNTTIKIFGLKQDNHFHIAVRNEGIPILPQDVKFCSNRGWRGEEAEGTTGEGGGIGLWVVENIMTAHNGELLITPTDSLNQTTIKLIFPI